MSEDKSNISIIRRVLFAQSLTGVASSIIGNPVLPLYYRISGASIEQLGLITMFNYVGYAIFEPLFGFFSDRVGRKKMISASIALNALVVYSYTFFRDINWFYVVSFLHAVCNAGFITPSRALIADITPKEKRGRNYGSFLSIQSFGRIIGPSIGGYLAYNISYESAFLVSALLTLISAANVLIFYPEDKKIFSNTTESSPDPYSILTRKTLIFIVSRALPFFFLFYSTILTVIIKESPKYNANEATLGLMATSISIVSLVAQYVSGLILDKIGSVRLIVSGFILDGFGYLLYLFADNLQTIWIVRIMIGAISPFYNVGMMVAMMEIVSPLNYGFAMGLYGLSEDIGGMVGSPLLSTIYQNYGFNVTTYFMTFLCFLAAAMVWFNMKESKKD
jgi:MFS family permease